MGRHAVNAGLAAGRAFDTGYEAVRKPFEEPGADIEEAHPFAPGTVSGGAIVAKTIRNLVSGSRQEANAREVLKRRGEASQLGELERKKLEQQIEAGTLQDYTDPTTGKNVQLPAGDIRSLIAKRIALAGRPATQKAGPDLSIRLERARTALEARVEREADELVATKDNTWAQSMRARALQGDVTALDKLGIPRSFLGYATGMKGRAPTPEESYSFQTVIDNAVKGALERQRGVRRSQVRAKYQQHFDAIEQAIQESGGLTQGGEAPPEDATSGAAPQSDSGGDPLLDEIRRRLDEEESQAQ